MTNCYTYITTVKTSVLGMTVVCLVDRKEVL